MRGKPRWGTSTACHARITPACAGKTSSPEARRRPDRDHPRVCGENAISRIFQLLLVGSPPRVRGKRAMKRMDRSGSRITPACAGKTRAKKLLSKTPQDHPRVCGENAIGSSIASGAAGSPPRVRGKRSYCDVRSGVRRITPACAGKTRQDRAQMARREDHPRVCGENRVPESASRPRRGSPPRVRGKHNQPARRV